MSVDDALRIPRQLAGCAVFCLRSLSLLYDRWLAEPDPAHWMVVANLQKRLLLADAGRYRQSALQEVQSLARSLAPALSGFSLRTDGWGTFATVSRAPVDRADVSARSAVEWACCFTEKVLRTVEERTTLPGCLVSERFRQQPGARWALSDAEMGRLREVWPQIQQGLLQLVARGCPRWQPLETEAGWEYGQVVGRLERQLEREPAGPERQVPPADELPPLTPKDMLILKALAEQHPKAMLQVDIEAASHLARRTIGPRLTYLRARHLTHRPHGKNKGEALTPLGLRVALGNC
jgi:hypothetical protein